MAEKEIENYIGEFLTENSQINALNFSEYLRANEMLFERCRNGYWEDKLYWTVKYKSQTVFQILINGYEEGHWVVWSDDSGSDWFRDFPLDEYIKETAWNNVGFCGKGGCCRNMGTRRMIFGREFDNVCIAALRFNNPGAEALECMKRMSEIRKNDILKNV